eukprot:CAMPEP_0203915932 /NCGR_PEP_ID=MMETSP0359-20131031/56651_1 /ASSEMBLY_ACC=CAM_ASM_000338 /TAXON_ID=268821 /ORGANISM="Scrippsiella Hangoei, Strain SHTV-5" /LENGTH=318 /DNA_ID=CAMNT_0050842523 /DNA_START=9 /DNA_END=965 /DNA_ORIENTATION=-
MGAVASSPAGEPREPARPWSNSRPPVVFALSLFLLCEPFGAAASSSAPSLPQGLGPQTLWPTPALVGHVEGGEELNSPLAAYVRSLADAAAVSSAAKVHDHSRASNGRRWRSEGDSFLGDAARTGGAVGKAARRLALRLRELGQRYFREALRDSSVAAQVDVLLNTSWASLVEPGAPSGGGDIAAGWLPHVHATAGLTGTYYVACGSAGEQRHSASVPPTHCGLNLEDPRPPAALSELPEAVRLRLGFGAARRFELAAGAAVLHPAWLVHAAQPFDGDGDGERIAISFTVNARLKPAAASPVARQSARGDAEGRLEEL